MSSVKLCQHQMTCFTCNQTFCTDEAQPFVDSWKNSYDEMRMYKHMGSPVVDLRCRSQLWRQCNLRSKISQA